MLVADVVCVSCGRKNAARVIPNRGHRLSGTYQTPHVTITGQLCKRCNGLLDSAQVVAQPLVVTEPVVHAVAAVA